MCCGMGHIEGLVTDIIKEGLRSGPVSTPYQGGNYQNAYQPQTYQDTGLEALTEKTLISYDLSLDGDGNVTGYMIEFGVPKGLDSRIAPDPKKTGVVLYDAASKEVIEIPKLYEGDVKTLKSPTQEHWVVPQKMIQKELVRQMFSAPDKEEVISYGAALQASQTQVDYTSRSDLRKKIEDRRKEIGLTPEAIEQIRHQAGQQNIMYN